jgi:ubiquinone/menaquinone biosynthesis C-methylase UbiE
LITATTLCLIKTITAVAYSGMDENSVWDRAYRAGRPEAIPWETGEPDNELVRLVEEGKIPAGKTLDACSGLGTQAIYLASRGFRVWGIDVSETAVAEAAERARSRGLSIEFISGTVQDLPFDDEFFDFVLDRGCLHHQYGQDLREYLAEARRVLRPEGLIYLMAFTSRFTDEMIERLFAKDFLVIEHFYYRHLAADNVWREFHGLLVRKC